jgi:hypothetical protein
VPVDQLGLLGPEGFGLGDRTAVKVRVVHRCLLVFLAFNIVSRRGGALDCSAQAMAGRCRAYPGLTLAERCCAGAPQPAIRDPVGT